MLIESTRAWNEVINRFARDHGYPKVAPAEYAASFGQSVAADVEQFFPGSTVAELEAYYDTYFPDHLGQIVVMDFAHDLLAMLIDRAVSTVLVTNTPAPLARRILELFQLPLDELVGGTDTPAAKPAPDMLLRACRLLSVDPREAVMIGDSRYDQEAASAAGVYFIGVGIDGDARVERLNELPALLLPDYAPD